MVNKSLSSVGCRGEPAGFPPWRPNPRPGPPITLGNMRERWREEIVAAGLVCSARLFAGRRRYRRFNLRRELLEMLKELPCCNSGENKPSGHYTMCHRWVCSNTLIKPDARESDRYVAVYCADSHYLACK
jgi:hypothetical protein